MKKKLKMWLFLGSSYMFLVLRYKGWPSLFFYMLVKFLTLRQGCYFSLRLKILEKWIGMQYSYYVIKRRNILYFCISKIFILNLISDKSRPYRLNKSRVWKEIEK